VVNRHATTRPTSKLVRYLASQGRGNEQRPIRHPERSRGTFTRTTSSEPSMFRKEP